MTTGWLLLLVLFVSSQSVDSQSTDDEVCDGEDDNMCDEDECFEMKRDIQMLQMGKPSTVMFYINVCFQPKFPAALLDFVLTFRTL